MKSDVLNAVDGQDVVLIVLLDLSAAFDTVDHGLLIQRLQNDIGVSETALGCFKSYLNSRSSCVSIDSVFSEQSKLIYGVPQGSVIGPVQFVIYTQPMGAIIRKHNVDFHSYADDYQLYVSFNPKLPGAAETALHKLQHCISDIKTWMNKNKLKLNNDKTEFFIAGTYQSLNKLPKLQLSIGESVIEPTSNIRNLGIIFDSNMTMGKQINSLISSGNYQLRNIRRICKYLDQDTRHLVVRALFLSRLDYGNALLYGSNSKDLNRLQSLQHRAVKLVFSASRLDSPLPLMQTLHWLPVTKRIKFKICLYVYKCLNDCGPKYLCNLLSHNSIPSIGPVTRSAMDRTLLSIPSSRKRIGERAFSVAGPSLWNSLPRHIRDAGSTAIFKKLLKSYLY